MERELIRTTIKPHACCDCAKCRAFMEQLDRGPAPLAPRTDDYRRAFEAMRTALSVLYANAVIGPDPRMEGLTDCYLVPLDDIQSVGMALVLADALADAATCAREASRG